MTHGSKTAQTWRRGRCKKCRAFVVIAVAVAFVLFWLYNLSKIALFVLPYQSQEGESVMLRPLLEAGIRQEGGTLSLTSNDGTRNATIVVYLRGEMANNLGSLAKAYTIQLEALQRLGISSTLVLRHQLGISTWTSARDNIQRCFPHLRGLNFSYANTKAFDQLGVQQESMLRQHGYDPERLRLTSFDDSIHSVHQALNYWNEILDSPVRLNDTNNTIESSWFPFLSVGSQRCPLDLMDKHLDSIRNVLFQFDTDACCKALPFADETVFHLRNFFTEREGRTEQKQAFRELSPNKTAQELLGHLQTGDPVAIVSRFDNGVQPYALALRREHGLQVRYVKNQSDVQDFCFLLKTSKELIGVYTSTYVKWAAFLGNASRVSLYRVVSPGSSFKTGPTAFNWTHPLLKDRVFCTTYASEI